MCTCTHISWMHTPLQGRRAALSATLECVHICAHTHYILAHMHTITCMRTANCHIQHTLSYTDKLECSLSLRTCAQSSFWPCYANEISVVLQSNVPLCAKGCMSQITISHFDGAEAASGPLEIRPFDASDEQLLTFSNAPRGKGGHGLWNNANKTLVLFMTCCMECNKEYRFRFTVKNPGQKCAPSLCTLHVLSLCTSRSFNVLVQRGANPRLYTRTHGTHTHAHTQTTQQAAARLARLSPWRLQMPTT